MARGDAHQEPEAGARIAEIERRCGLGETADAAALNPPEAGVIARDLGAERAERRRCALYVVGLEEALNHRFGRPLARRG